MSDNNNKIGISVVSGSLALLLGMFLIVYGCKNGNHIPDRSVKAAQTGLPLPSNAVENSNKRIAHSVGSCALHVIRLKSGSYKIDVSADSCDPLSEPLVSELNRQFEALLRAENQQPENISVQIYLYHHPTIIKKWAAVLQRSKEWKNCSQKENAGEIAEYTLIVKMMSESGIFAGYQTLFTRLGYDYDTVVIEKVDFSKAGEYSHFSRDIKPLGYTGNERIPVPMMTVLKFKKITNKY